MGDGCSLRPPDATAIPFKILLTHKFALFASWTTSQSSTLYTYHIISLTSLFPSGLSYFAFIPSFLFICSFFVVSARNVPLPRPVSVSASHCGMLAAEQGASNGSNQEPLR